MNVETEKDWFANWFDSPWYHLLYRNRDEKEAEGFVARVMVKLNLPLTSRVLDLACGKGRHSKFIHSLGYQVLGVDLSESSIREAKKMESEGLQFRTGDMRLPQGREEFDLVLNLFTSFGYFEKEEDNIKVLQAIRQSLKPGGMLLLDFMNTSRVLKELVPENKVERDGIIFNLKRSLENGCILKAIDFEAHGRKYQYFERVQALKQSNFLSYFAKSGMELVLLCGNYDLEPFSEEHSDRMIFLVRKT